jgi:hypothetical protein
VADSKPIKPAPMKAIRVVLALGAALLVVGCYAGFARSGNSAFVFAVFGSSVVLFAVALAMLLRRPSHPAAEPAQAESPQRVTKAEPLPGAVSKAELSESRVVAVAQVGPHAHAAVVAEPAAQGAAAAAPPVPASMPVPATAEAPRAEARLDVATLMTAPLSDLLLAALCKDAAGARRIFAQAILQAEPPAAAPPASAMAEPALR